MRTVSRRVGVLFRLATAALLAACAEGTGPESLGQLRLRPVFAPGEEPGTLGVAVSQIRIVLRRTDGAVLADTSLPYVTGETTSWLVDLDHPPESVGISANIGQGAATMYSGTGQASLSAGIGPSSTQHDLPVRYLGGTGATFSIDVSPDSVALGAAGETQQFSAVARDAGGAALTGFSFSWASSRPDVATVNATTGLVTAVSTGGAEITATSGGVTGSAKLSVGPASRVPVAITVIPDSGLLAIGDTLRFKAVAFDQLGSVIPAVVFTWTTSATLVASVDTNGLSTARSVGETKVIASLGALVDSATLRVVDDGGEPGVASITVNPAAATLTSLGDAQQFTATARDAQGNVMTGVVFAWTSSNPSVATVTADGGLGTAISRGTVTISASAAGVSGTATLTVAQVVKSVSLLPPNASVLTGASTLFIAVAFDGNGHVIPGTAFSWSTSNPSIATIDNAGIATGVSHGSTFVRASAGGLTAAGVLTVITLASIEIEGGEERPVTVGATLRFTAVVRDVGGNIVKGIPVQWSVLKPTVATIDPVTGVATGLNQGLTVVRATFANLMDQVELVVRPRP
jgi:uncharacterized protein YjdB